MLPFDEAQTLRRSPNGFSEHSNTGAAGGDSARWPHEAPTRSTRTPRPRPPDGCRRSTGGDLADVARHGSGERREEREEGGDEQGYKAIERSYGSFCRTVPLPQKVNLEKLTAKMQDGVLQITVPLDESARPRRIQIET
jgi:hypothetical protein